MEYAVGLMSGTSMDGCDAALVMFDGARARLSAYIEKEMPEALRQKAMDACSKERSNVFLLCQLNFELGHWFAEAALQVCEKGGVDPRALLCVGSHGQTVCHIPAPETGAPPSTLQLGEPAVIARETGAPVVSSFRAKDMAAGGQGAPLVPYPEFLLYRCEDKARALLNLGGIGNITLLPRACALEDVLAFDTGPGNMVIDEAARVFFDAPFDRDGKIVSRGRVNPALLDQWMALPYIAMKPPKSTGREDYGAQFTREQIRLHPEISPEDFIATATAYTSASVAVAYRRFLAPRGGADELILSGGGARNPALRSMIQAALPEVSVTTQEALGYNGDAKEAVAFAIIARETMRRRPGNAPGATGARARVVLGSVTWPD